MSVPSPSTIVVPLDGSEFPTRAVPAAAVVARGPHRHHPRWGGHQRPRSRVAVPTPARSHRALPAGTDVTEDLIVDPDPVAALLQIASDPSRVLFLVSHDRMPPAAAILGSVGSRVIERASCPLFVVGPAAAATTPGNDVAVALDGRHDPEPLLAAAVGWAR